MTGFAVIAAAAAGAKKRTGGGLPPPEMPPEPPEPKRYDGWILVGIFGFVIVGLTLAGIFGKNPTAREQRERAAIAACEAKGHVIVELREGRHGTVYDRLCLDAERIPR